MSEKAHVLVVDDDIGICETISDILAARGYQIATAEDGFRAIERVRGSTFDVVLMDVKMPGMNGVETYREMKKIRPRMRVIMMTAYTLDELIRDALREGASGVLYKPFDIARLTRLIDEDRAEIMLVDDDPYFCDMLKDALERKGYRVSIAGEGLEAVEMARRASYDLFFIDMKLPTINGLETYLALREIDPKVQAIMMTGYRNETNELVSEALRNSAFTCLYKPFDLRGMVELIELIQAERLSSIL